MRTISASQPVPTVPSSVTASPGAVHEAHTLMPLNSELLRCDADVQPRLALSEAHIQEYAALLQEGHQLGTIVVFQDGSDYYLADGFHRVAAAKSIGLEELPAEIRVGAKRDAMIYACAANKHGKPLSNRDKQRVVLHLLKDAAWGQWSDREIVRHCGVSHVFVVKRRKALTGNVTSERTYHTKHGTQATIDTTAIGKHAVPDAPEDASMSHVSHASAGDTITAEVVAGEFSMEAVTSALQQHEGDRPTAAVADTRSQSTDRQVTVTITDGLVHESLQEAETVRAAFPTRLFQLLEPLQELITIRHLEQLLMDMPSDYAARVDQCLTMAFGVLNELRSLWKKHRHEAPGVLVQPRAPQRVKQSTKRNTRRKTKAKPRQPAQPAHATMQTVLSQPDLLLAAIRTTQQPLMIENLRQISGVDGRRVKRNVTWLVAQGKIQETLAGYVAVSA